MFFLGKTFSLFSSLDIIRVHTYDVVFNLVISGTY